VLSRHTDAAEPSLDLGTYRRQTSTASAEAQEWFDRGLIWAYGFNHEESVRCFRRATVADPGFALAYWGIAYASGPNYNKAWEDFDPLELSVHLAEAFAAAEHARALGGSASGVEAALIEALAQRYAAAVPPVDALSWNRGYAAAMREVYAEHRDDLDVAALFAEALMNLNPWDLWDLPTGRPRAGAHTEEIREVLERSLGLPGGSEHPGLLHFYLHAMEMSPFPEVALSAADRLSGLCPDAGHLEHMPSHIYVLCGDYARTIDTNTAAMRADARFLAGETDAQFYTLYVAHNMHFKAYGAMFAGRLADALSAADALAQVLDAPLLGVASPPMADWLEGFVAVRLHVLVRFGRWEEILAVPPPADPELFCVTATTRHYARGIALAVLGRVEQARAEAEHFSRALARVPDSRTIFNNTCRDILAIAESMLAGEIAYRGGDLKTAFERLGRAVELDDGLPYDEPWGWMQPARHALGALLLEQGRHTEAEAVYRADLGLDATLSRACQHPGNVWSLHGLHACLTASGRTGEATLVAQQLELAAARADVPIAASCFCAGAGQTGHGHDCCAPPGSGAS
jgi:tetratricopeptide (TPR) repeat protein